MVEEVNKKKQVTENPQGEQSGFAPTGNTHIDNFLGNLKGGNFNRDEYVQNIIGREQARLGQERDAKMSAIEKALQNQLTDVDLEKSKIDPMFEQNKSKINEESYNAMERAKQVGSNRGLMASPQQMGQEQGVIRNSQKLHAENRQARDEQLNNIQARITNLKNQADLSKQMTISDYETGLTRAESEANVRGDEMEMQNNQMYNDLMINAINYATGREDRYEDRKWFEEDRQTSWDREDSVYEKRRQDAKDDEKELYDLNLQRRLNQYTPGTKEYNIEIKAFERDLAQMEKKMNKEFDIAMKNELKKYTKGTTAYKVVEGQFKQQKKLMDLEFSYQKELAKYNASLSRSYGGGGGGYSYRSSGGNGYYSNRSGYGGSGGYSGGYSGGSNYVNNTISYINDINNSAMSGGTWGSYNQGISKLNSFRSQAIQDPNLKKNPSARNQVLKEIDRAINQLKQKKNYAQKSGWYSSGSVNKSKSKASKSKPSYKYNKKTPMMIF